IYVSYKLVFKKAIQTEAINLIPPDAIFILETEQPVKNWRSFSSSNIWTFLKTHPYLHDLNADARYLDSLMNENKTLLKYFGDRSFHLSAHMTHKNDYDFLFLVDLKKTANFNPSLLLIKSILDSDEFKVTKQEYKSHKVFNIHDLEDGDYLYMSKVANFMVFSYSLPVLKNSLDLKSEYSLLNDRDFVEASDMVSSKGLARLYIQYDFIDEYLNIYTKANENLLQSFSNSFAYSGLDISIADKRSLMEGFTSIPDSIEQYSSLIQEYGNTSLQFHHVISSRTAFAQVIGLKDFKTFYNKLLELKQNNPETIQNYNQVKTKVENVLNLSLEDDLLSWIGKEAVIARNEPNKYNQFEDDYILAIKTNDINVATKKLLNIQKQIKKRTPAKFQKMSYKTNSIYFLDIKGFFGLFFGKAFDKITKPYYTVIEDYVVFSNKPTSLIAAIEDYENGNILANLPSFKKITDAIPKNVAIFTYANGDLAYNSLTKTIENQELKKYKANKKYFNFFKSVGVAYTSEGKGFKNVIVVHHDEANDIALPPAPLIDSLKKSYFKNYASELQNLSEAETFVLYNINNGEFITYHGESNQIHIKAQTKKGKFHGKFIEYYKNGETRVQGKYRKGKKVGRWKYYNFDGQLTEKEWSGL
ncbi:MAG: DUF3352 domain-containing protein, partial [Bacteroidia bacterium]|nr:DUF3352 domain-containing protein [Bacteroidia bacterium]